MRKLSLCLALLAFSLPSLAQDVPAAPPTPAPLADPGTATVYIYRLSGDYARIVSPPIIVDQKEIMKMHHGRFLALPLTPGQHNIKSDLKGNELIIDAKPGETYYIHVAMTSSTAVKPTHGHLAFMDAIKGQKELSKLKPVKPGQLDDDEKPDHP
jgi:hypothetical protein